MSQKQFFKVCALTGAGLLAGTAVHAQVLNATGGITVDGDPSEWGAIDGSLTDNMDGVFSSGSVGSQYMYLDPTGDDTGDGDYVYPTNATWDGTEHDIGEVRVAYDFSNVYFLVTIPGDADFFGAFGGRVAIWIDRADVSSNLATNLDGYINFCQSPSINFPGSFNWDYHLSNRGGFEGAYFYTSDSQSAEFPGPLQEGESTANSTVELAIPWASIGGYPTMQTDIQMALGVGGPDGGNWRNTNEVVSEFGVGGGCDNNGECFTLQNSPALFDMIGADLANQQADLTAIDCAASPAVPPTANNSIVAFSVDPAQAVGVSDGSLYFDNNFVRLQYSQPTTGADAENPANYTVVNANPDNVTVTDAANGGGFTYLTLSRNVTLDDITNGITVQVSDTIMSDGGDNVAPGTTVDINGLLTVIPVSMDASADPQTFLSTPRIFGDWDGFSTLYPLSDGTDPYPDVPGDQTEAGDTAGDGVLQGRVFTTADTSNVNYAFVSDYDFGALAATEPVRRLGSGYWGQNYDLLNNGEPINRTKAFLSSRLATPVTVTFNLAVLSFEFASAGDAQAAEFYVQAGGTFGTENALPTDPPSDMPGAADVTGGLLMTYVNESGGFYNYTATATYPQGIPDVGSFRFGYVFGGNTVREEEADTFGQQGNVGQGGQTTKDTTIHYHLARVASDDGSRAVGRTLNFEFRTVGNDITPPPSDAITTNVGDWMILE